MTVAADPKPDQARVDAQVIVARLMKACEAGSLLGDPRQPGCIATWAKICDGVPDDTVRQLIPGIIRLLFRKSAMAPLLQKAGLKEALALQHEAIPPFVIAFRRMKAIRAGGDLGTDQLLAETRKELRDLNARFHAALDEAIRLSEENTGLRRELVQVREVAARAQEEADRYKKDASTFYNELEDTRAKALTKLKLALEDLKDAMTKRTNDPESMLVASKSLAVQSYFMLCEDLGRGAEAVKLSNRILGDAAPFR